MTKLCQVDGCDKDVWAKDLCNTHYMAARRSGTLITKPNSRPYPKRGEALQLILQTVANPPAGCVLWPYSVNTNGYGKLKYQGRLVVAHRLSLFLHDELHVMPSREWVARHICPEPNPLCINPLHLAWGTDRDNMQDAVEMGTIQHGETHCFAKLTEDDVRAIRESGDTHDSLALRYGVSRVNVTKIINGQIWKHLL